MPQTSPLFQRDERSDLSFHGHPLKKGRHKIHPYPAMLHPLLADFLIKQYGKSGDIVFDPFCGSGVTLLQSAIRGHKSIGFDINPLALLIARTKTRRYAKHRLLDEFASLREVILATDKADIPEVKNIDYWFSSDSIDDLGRIRSALKEGAYRYRDFFITIFAFVCRNQSYTRKGEFKRYREKQVRAVADKQSRLPLKTDSSAFTDLFSRIAEMIEIFGLMDIPKESAKPILANSEHKPCGGKGYDLVITSPPYGDSKTTVAYGEYTSFGSDWIEGLNVYGGKNPKIDKEGLGKPGELNKGLEKHGILMDLIEEVDRACPKRAKEVLYFFNGYYNAIRNITGGLNHGGRVCFVVGNRRVKEIQVPMDQITASFFQDMGLAFEAIHVRDILNKVMPSHNSPTNKTGIKSKTMMNEYVVVFRKE